MALLPKAPKLDMNKLDQVAKPCRWAANLRIDAWDDKVVLIRLNARQAADPERGGQDAIRGHSLSSSA